MLILLRLEGNVEGSRLDTKADKELLKEISYAQVHKQAIDHRNAIRGHTPEPAGESSTAQDRSLALFDASIAGGKDYFCLSHLMFTNIIIF